MAAVTAKMVKDLREMTGAGMMDCKKALAATDGDMDKAVEFLREKGLAGAEKKAGRIAAEGIVDTAMTADEKKAVIVEVNAETDFVAKNAKFQAYVAQVAAQALTTTAADMDAFMDEKWAADESLTVKEALSSQISIIGENMSIRRFARIADGFSVPYVHMKGKIGVIVNLTVEGCDATEIGKDIAMQIAALNPRFWDKSQVTQDVLDEEKEVMLGQMANDPKMANKPDQVKEKIVMGKLNKFYAENCLLQQAFVKDGDVSVEQYMNNAAKALGGKVSFNTAVRFEKGEGIEKKEENYAEEIAKMTGNK